MIPIIVDGAVHEQTSLHVGMPSHPAAIPDDAAFDLYTRVRSTDASALDQTLPALPIDEWLTLSLGPMAAPTGTLQIFWQVQFCDAPNMGPICVEAAVPLPDGASVHGKYVHVAVEAGELLFSPGKKVGWRATLPRVRHIYIDRIDQGHPVDSQTVASLAALHEALLVPTELWPSVDLVSTITASTNAPLAGETVRFTIEVTNRGGRRLERAWVHTTGRREGAADITQDWFRPIDAGETVRFDFAAVLPVGRATILATARPAQSVFTYRGAEGYVEPSVLIIGGGTWRRQ